MMELIQEKGFTLSVSLDGGSVLVTYPYDKPVQPGLISLLLIGNKCFNLCQLAFDVFGRVSISAVHFQLKTRVR